jgi:ketosteroid isomerase-like protein
VPRRLDPVREAIRAFNEQDLDALVAILDPDVEVHSMRGRLKGIDAVRKWATRTPGGVQQTLELDQLYEDGTENGGGSAVALVTRRWHWEEDGSEAGVEELAFVYELQGGKILSWRPVQDRAEALRAGGFEHGIAAE